MTRALLIATVLVFGATTADAQARRRPVPRRPAQTDPDRFDWHKVTGTKPKATAYELAMARADTLARRAYLQGGAGNTALLDRAIEAYELAAAADPSKAEPHYVAGLLLKAIHAPERVSIIRGDALVGVERMLAHWREFERLAATDPRIHDILDDRAITLTKVATDKSYLEAIDNYDRMLKVLDLGSMQADDAARILGNSAEVFMMTGKTHRAIELYARSLDFNRDYLAGFGLAVALDRDGQAMKAREVMIQYALDGYLREFAERLKRGSVFYVPDGEVHYYFALIHEVLGNDAIAIEQYQAFIDSGAHPQFHRRAKGNIDDLRKRMRSGQPKPPLRDAYGRPVRQDLTWWREASAWLGP